MGCGDHTARYEVLQPAKQTLPLVVSSPHSGRDYPESFLAASRLDALSLRRSEDGFVDELFAGAPASGAPLLHALFPRAYIDVNREPYELDPAMFDGPLPAHVNAHTPRVRGGLGTVARIVAGGAEIYRRKLGFAEAEQRVRECYRPYHDALAGLSRATRERFGFAVLLDCHSMPSTVAANDDDGGAPLPDIVLGDRFGSSCHADITANAEAILAGLGYSVRRNTPYAGGFITQYYGRPASGVHALQIEINRRLYMDETGMTRGPGFERVAGDMSRLVEGLAGTGLTLLAAE